MTMADTPYRCYRCGKVFEDGQYLEYLNHLEKKKCKQILVIRFYPRPLQSLITTSYLVGGVAVWLSHLFFPQEVYILHSSIMLKLAKEIKFVKQDSHISDYYNNLQARLIQACIKDDSHTKRLSEN